jgi:rubrerythrin
MGDSTADAIREAILTEKNSFEFYRLASEAVANEGTKQVFEFLAGEELEHLNAFLKLYEGDEFGELHSLVKQPYDPNHPVNRALLEAVDQDMTEEHALNVSMREEQSCIDRYTVLIAAIKESAPREVFAKALKETRKHYEVIKEEYMRVMAMVDRSDQDIYVRE